MHQATAGTSASAFDKTDTLAPWSGRIDPADLSRPAGLLMAALSQCARERGLSMSQMASAMDVSYWSVSQLRIGIRRLQSLDEDMAAACASFLDRPLLTIHMLAGLLEPAQALATADLTPEDILHARHLLATEPADVALVAPASRSRPLQTLSVDELATLQREWGRNPAVARALRAEMAQRPLSRAEALRKALSAKPVADPPGSTPVDAPVEPASVDKARVDKAPAFGIMRCSCQKRLRIPHMAQAGEIRCPACQTEYAVDWQETVCVVQHQVPAQTDEDSGGDAPGPDESALDPAQAWRVLGLAPGTSWPAVERARRSLLQQYHPDRLGHVSPLVQKLAQDAFRRVGDAYEVLKAQR
jgi:transcriptional regulator with XRE-family HTH domain